METLLSTLNWRTATVADVIAAKPAAIQNFKKHAIDYCCGGKKGFVDACEEIAVNPETLWHSIEEAAENPASDVLRFQKWNTPFLINYILENHHAYVRESIPEIKQLLKTVLESHGEDHIELNLIDKDFAELCEELLPHLEKEEKVLFPLIKSLEDVQNKMDYFGEDAMRMPIEMMEQEHELAGGLMKSIRTLTNKYTPPSDACPTFQHVYALLKEFDDDLMMHIYLENSVLFPRMEGLLPK